MTSPKKEVADHKLWPLFQKKEELSFLYLTSNDEKGKCVVRCSHHTRGLVTRRQKRGENPVKNWKFPIVASVIAFLCPLPGSLWGSPGKSVGNMVENGALSSAPARGSGPDWLQLKAIAATEINSINVPSLCAFVCVWASVWEMVWIPLSQHVLLLLLLLHSFTELQHSSKRQRGQRSGGGVESGCSRVALPCGQSLSHPSFRGQSVCGEHPGIHVIYSEFISLLCFGSAPFPNSCSDTCVHSWICTTAFPQGIACPPPDCRNCGLTTQTSRT